MESQPKAKGKQASWEREAFKRFSNSTVEAALAAETAVELAAGGITQVRLGGLKQRAQAQESIPAAPDEVGRTEI